jgi:hypothetical protein
MHCFVPASSVTNWERGARDVRNQDYVSDSPLVTQPAYIRDISRLPPFAQWSTSVSLTEVYAIAIIGTPDA